MAKFKFNPKRIAMEEIEEKDIKHDNKKILRLDEKHIGWHGSTPFVEFDENFVQMKLTRTQLVIPREHSTRMAYLSWWSGFIAGARGQVNIRNFLIAIIILVIIGAGLTYFTSNNTTSSIGALAGNFTALRNEIGTILAIVPQNTTPVV